MGKIGKQKKWVNKSRIVKHQKYTTKSFKKIQIEKYSTYKLWKSMEEPRFDFVMYHKNRIE